MRVEYKILRKKVANKETMVKLAWQLVGSAALSDDSRGKDAALHGSFAWSTSWPA
jgi:hypothetical protein